MSSSPYPLVSLASFSPEIFFPIIFLEFLNRRTYFPFKQRGAAGEGGCEREASDGAGLVSPVAALVDEGAGVRFGEGAGGNVCR